MLGLTMNEAEGTMLLSVTHFNPQNEQKEIQVRESDYRTANKQHVKQEDANEQVGQTFDSSRFADHLKEMDAFDIDYINNVH